MSGKTLVGSTTTQRKNVYSDLTLKCWRPLWNGFVFCIQQEISVHSGFSVRTIAVTAYRALSAFRHYLHARHVPEEDVNQDDDVEYQVNDRERTIFVNKHTHRFSH